MKIIPGDGTKAVEMSKDSSFMDSLQKFIDKINEKYGGIGSVIGVIFWVLVYIYSLKAILRDFFGN